MTGKKPQMTLKKVLCNVRHSRVHWLQPKIQKYAWVYAGKEEGPLKGLFTWREEDPSTRKILEGGSS